MNPDLKYPTMEQVEAADEEQLAGWYRDLPTPGGAVFTKLLGGSTTRQFQEDLYREQAILKRIVERYTNSLVNTTLEEVEAADDRKIRWLYNWLPSPATVSKWVTDPEAQERLTAVCKRVEQRFHNEVVIPYRPTK